MVGAGIAGLSVAAELARTRRVVVLEACDAPATQSTGRSAAVYIERYGGPAFIPFNRAGRAWFASRADGESDHALLAPRGLLSVAPPGTELRLPADPELDARIVGPEEARSLFPALRPEATGSALHVPGTADLDPAGAVAVYRRLLRARGGTLVTSAPAERLVPADGTWTVTTPVGGWVAPLVVNAAGAWADVVAERAGLPPLGSLPLRRTIATLVAPRTEGADRWPLLEDTAETFYLKPETGRILASPADETPDVPRDVRPEMLDVAGALDRVAAMTTLDVRVVTSSWAGLRTFAPDRAPVLGPDPLAPGFAWYAGQGGCGIQIAPAAARAVVALVETGDLPEDIRALGGSAAHVRPDRLRRAG
ncbi:MAG: NAD(P)/FAD-dependent oxidoreductase [Chloroflexota bacterium]